ncbi:MAG: D-alanyl-D-alanine carboxypeptidase [Sphaerobacteraceae bacterium]|nr:MAG: D-alanyl-D-alanine carboxypeptidase [Sphaerobacteraceae bacterium]
MNRMMPRVLLVVTLLVVSVLVQPGAITNIAAQETDDADSPLMARNAIVVDAESGQVLFDQGMDDPVPPASLTKIFTSIVALETAALEAEVTVDEYDLVGEASIGLTAGETVKLETLLHGLLLTSGNDSAMTIARELGYLPGDSPQESVARFVDRANATAERLGLSNTTLRNPHGLDQSGHLSSASDVAAMTMYALDNPVFEQLISTPYYSGDGREFYNVNQFLDVYPGLIGGKTGITTKAGHSLVQVAERDGHRVIVVLLGSTREHWYSDAEYLLNYGFEQLAENPDDSTRPVIGVAGVTGLDVPDLAAGTSVGGNLTVDRVSDHEAVVRPSTPMGAEDSASWRWAVIVFGMMAVALALVLYHQAIIGMGALVFAQGTRLRWRLPSPPSLPSTDRIFKRSTRHQRHERPTGGWEPTTTSELHGSSEGIERLRTSQRDRRPTLREDLQKTNAGSLPSTVSVSPARWRAENAIKLAMQGRYHLATEEFRLALERDPDVDVTKCPGFWRMQPMGYVAVAKAYSMNQRSNDARRLLTVVQLAFKQNEELSHLFGMVIQELENEE